MTNLTILGPQYPEPRLSAELLGELGAKGTLCAITAGWQEREGELEELQRDLGQPVVDLQLYHRAEQIHEQDPELAQAHRERQDKLKELQRLYRLRLHHAREAARELLAFEGEPSLVAPEQRAALAALRNLDRHHLHRIARIHKEFEADWRPRERASVRGHRQQLGEVLATSSAVLIAGGHVGALVSRLRLFGLREWLVDKPVIAWSGGAMVLTEKVVLFHDHPPQGQSAPEVLDAGLGLLRGYVLLPHASKRLALDDPPRVSLFARRFLPARAITLESGSLLRWLDGRLTHSEASERLTRTGQLTRLPAA